MMTTFPWPKSGPGGARLLTAALIALLLSAPLAWAHEEHETAPPAAVDWPAGDASSPAMGQRLDAIGFLPLPGFNADVWTHRDFAYVGTWGSVKDAPRTCPASGVRVVDLTNPRQPVLTGVVANIPGTSQEDVVVKRIETPAFQGDLLATGIQACVPTSGAARGFDLWDVTDSRQPRHLAFWSSGAGGAPGVHELHLFERGGRAYIAAAVPFAEERDRRGEIRFVDVTDPRRPVEVGSWSAGANGFTPRQGQTFFGHSVTTNAAGTLAVVSYWDAGAMLLDVSDLRRPRLLSRIPGRNMHSVAFAHGERVLLAGEELGQPENGTWGYLHLWDIGDPTRPREIGHFATPNAAAGRPGGVFAYSVHNPVVRGNVAYMSWYAEGVRVVDISNPAAPLEFGAFVPPPARDPFGLHDFTPQVWGVHVDRGLVVVSDTNAGLYVLQTTPHRTERCFEATGHCVGGRFLDYWEEHGGLAVNGYPISDEFTQVMEDGRERVVQYFERSRLEHHPENAWPYDVLLGQFGRRLRPADPPVAPLPGALHFGETGHNLSGDFLRYWQRHGGLPQFGYPISEEFEERQEDDRTRVVQYFERARFERHLENPSPYDILLGLFGRRILEMSR